MPQLVRMTNRMGFSLYFKWPYHAKVMKTLEQMSRTMGSQRESVSEFMNLFSEHFGLIHSAIAETEENDFSGSDPVKEQKIREFFNHKRPYSCGAQFAA